MSDLHLDSSFYKQSMNIDNYVKIKEWIHSSIGQSTLIQEMDKRRLTLSNLNQTQNRRRYVNFENGSHFDCSLNLNKSLGGFHLARQNLMGPTGLVLMRVVIIRQWLATKAI